MVRLLKHHASKAPKTWKTPSLDLEFENLNVTCVSSYIFEERINKKEL